MNDFENESFAFMRMTWENSDAAESRIQDSVRSLSETSPY